MHQIIEDSSTVAYDDYCQTRKRTHTVMEEVTEEASDSGFDYAVMKDQPPAQNYVCYPNAQPQWTCVPQPGTVMPQPVHFTNYPQPAGYQQYFCYNSGCPFPGPTVCAPMGGLPSAALPAPAAEPKPKSVAKNVWLGRTKAQVDEDNVKIALRENVYRYDPMKPAGAAADQLFWVVEIDGRTTLRDFRTIDEDLQPGKWERDPRYDNAYFVREEVKEEKKDDEKK